MMPNSEPVPAATAGHLGAGIGSPSSESIRATWRCCMRPNNRAPAPATTSASPIALDAREVEVGVPCISCKNKLNLETTKPRPASAIAVRIHARRVRSAASCWRTSTGDRSGEDWRSPSEWERFPPSIRRERTQKDSGLGRSAEPVPPQTSLSIGNDSTGVPTAGTIQG